MSRISNERIKALTLNESKRYSKAYAKEAQRRHMHNVEHFTNSYKVFMK